MARWSYLFVILIPHLVSGETPKYGVYGKTLHLNPGTTGQPDNILWKHKGNKVVEFDGKEQVAFSQFQNRVDLDWISAELNITDLRYDDSGEYELEIVKKKQVQIFKYTVVVIGKISKPKISCDINNGNSSTHGTQATLTCSADSRTPMTYEWDSDGKMRQGPKLTISLGEKHDDQTHTCTVTNPLDSERVTFTAKDCHPAHSILPVVLGVGIAALILVVLAVLLYCLKQKKKACFAEGNGKGIEAPQNEDEHKKLIDRTPTMPSTQQLHNLNRGHGNKTGHEMERGEEPVIDELQPKVPAGFVEERKRMLKAQEDNWKNKKKNTDDAEEDEHIREPPENMVQEYEPSDTEEATEPEPAGGSDHREDTQTDVETFAASEQPEKNLNKENKARPSIAKKPAVHPLGKDKDDAEADESIRETPENMAPEFELSDTKKANEPEPAGGSDHREDTESAPEHPEKKPPPPIARKPTVQNKACTPSDTEKPNEPEPAGESDHREETQTDVESSAAPKQPEEHLDKDKTTCPLTPPKKPARQIPVNQPVNNSDAEKDESGAPQENKVPEREPSDTEKANEPEPAGGSEHSEDEQAEVESPVAPQREKCLDKDKNTCPSPPLNQPGSNKENAEKDESAGPSENKVPECEPSDTEETNEPDTQADVGSSTAPQPLGLEKEHKTTVSQHPPENKVTECEPSDTEKANEPGPAVGLDHREDTQAP